MRTPLGISLGLAVLLLLGTASVSAAHATLLRSEPAAGQRLAEAPARVRLWFDEELDTRDSTVSVIDGQGRRVDSGDGHVDLDDPSHASMLVSLPPLPEGVYLVRWQAVTIDDDGLTQGEFEFFVGDTVPRQKPARSETPLLTLLAAGIFTAVMIVTAGLAWRAVKH